MDLNETQLAQIANSLNKTIIESNKAEHPSHEDIYLFNSKTLPEEEMMSLKKHLAYCIKCEEILEDVQFFQEIERGVDSGELTTSVNLPSFADLKVKATQELDTKTEVTTTIWQDIPETVKNGIQSIAHLWNERLVPAIQEAATDGMDSVDIKIGEETFELNVYASLAQRELLIYSNEEYLIGKCLVIVNKRGEDLAEGVFDLNSIDVETKICCILEIPKSINSLEQIKSLKWKIREQLV